MKKILLLSLIIITTSCTTTDIYGNTELSAGGWVFIIGLILIVIIAIKSGSKDLARSKRLAEKVDAYNEELKQRLSDELKDATQVIWSRSKDKYVAVFESKRLLNLDGDIIKYEDILHVELRTDDAIVAQKSNKNTIGRAIVGGVLAGGAGAIIGGVTGKTTSQKQFNKISVVVGQSSLSRPTISLVCYRRNELNKDKNVEEQRANQAMSFAQKAIDLIGVVIDKIEKEGSIKNVSQQINDTPPESAPSITDELIKAKELLNQGIITQEEFETLKVKLLK